MRPAPTTPRRKKIKTVRPLTDADTGGAPFIAIRDAARLTGLGEDFLRRTFQIKKFGNADFIRVKEVNDLILGD